MAELQMRFLGDIEISLDDAPLANLKSKKALALLAYLAVTGAAHERLALATLLWGDTPEANARMNLRKVVAALRKAVDAYLIIGKEQIALDRDSPHWIDVGNLEEAAAALNRLGQDEEPDLSSVQAAIDLYRGDFLASFYVRNAPLFEEWALTQQARLRETVLDALHRLANGYAEQGQLSEAIKATQRLLQLEPWREEAHRQLMQFLAQDGRRSEALAQYETCRQILADEFGAEPAPATVALFEAIRDKKFEKPVDLEVGAEWTRPEVQIPPPPSPYRGLFAFREQDAAFYFGREAISERLLAAIRQQPLLAIIGPSGSGKSSLAAAGLVAGLRPEKNWRFAIFRPGSRPFQALAAALVPLLDPDLNETESLIEAGKMAGALREGVLSLEDVLDRTLQLIGLDGRLLLLGDQFEELYTLCPDDALRQRFLQALLGVVEKQGFRRQPAVSVALTLRADFMEQALAYRPLADALQEAAFILGPMTRQELALAIEKPAEVQAVEFEAGLVERILDDVGSEPGNLPLLEFALTELWEEQAGWQLTHEAYEAIGRVEGALARYADDVYKALSADEQNGARRVFVQMVRPGERTEDTRRLAQRQEIGEQDWSLVQRLADTRLVVTGRDPGGQETAELVHETLIWRWGRLRSWLEEDRAFRSWQERLRAALEAWQASDGDEGALLRGRPLAEAEGWLSEWSNRLSPAEEAFIGASLELRDRRQQEQEEAQAARERTRRRIAIGLASGLVLALILSAAAGLGWLQANQSQQELAIERDLTQEALAKLLASQSELLLEESLDQALLLSIEAVNIDPSVETQSSLLSALSQNPQLDRYLHGHEDEVRSVAYSPDGQKLASGGADGTILLWDISGSEGISSNISLEGHSDSVTGLTFSPDGQTLASASFDDMVRLWDVATGEAAAPPLIGHEANIWSLAFSPDGQMLASAGADGRVFFWDTDPASASYGQPFDSPLQVHDGIVSAAAFNPANSLLATGASDGSVVLWDVSELQDGEGTAVVASGASLSGHEARIGSVAFSPDGALLASGGNDGRIIVWDSDPASPSFGQKIGQEIVASDDWITGLAFHPDGNTLAAAGRDNSLAFWDLSEMATSGQAAKGLTMAGHQGGAWSLAYSPDGKFLLSGGGDSRVILWHSELAHPLARPLAGQSDSILGLTFSPDGSLLASGSQDGTFIFWDPVTGQSILGPIEADESGLLSLAFSRDGATLATGGFSDEIRFWQADAGSENFGKQIGSSLQANQKDVNNLAFHPQEPILFSAGADGTVVLWDMDPESASFGQPLGARLSGHEFSAWGLEFDPSGKKLATSALSGPSVVWDLESDPPEDEWLGGKAPTEEVFEVSMDFNPNEPLLVVGSFGELSFWDTSDPSPSKWRLIGQPFPARQAIEVFAGRFSPDGGLLVVGVDNRLLFFDAASRQQMGPSIQLHPGQITRLSFNRDGTLLASSDHAGSIILWAVDLESWIEIACSRANRNFTQEEWDQFFGREPYRATCPGLPAG